jgi:filamentation induced by cAMP protein fic
MEKYKWIWQNENYPNFTYDVEKIRPFLEKAYTSISLLRESEMMLENNLANSINLKTYENEIVGSSLIEGEQLNSLQVRSSLRTRLLIDPSNKDFIGATPKEDALVELFLDSVKRMPASFSKEILLAWHEQLFSMASPLKKRQVSLGKYRTDEIDIVSGSIGFEKIHYAGVPSQRVEELMDGLIVYIQSSKDDPITKSAIAHIAFEIIHPLDDGNGRIGRLISNMILPKDFSSKCSISQYINLHRKDYYDALANASVYSNKCDLTDWIIWFSNAVTQAVELRISLLQKELNRDVFFKNISEQKNYSLSPTQKKVLEKIINMDDSTLVGNFDVKKYRSLAGGKISIKQASEEMMDLIDLDCFEKGENFWKIIFPEKTNNIFLKIFKTAEDNEPRVKGVSGNIN